MIIFLLAATSCISNRLIENENINTITLEKTSCFGNCPVFMIKVFQNGEVQLVGKENLPYIGSYCAHLDKSRLDSLFDAFNSHGFFDFKDSYTSNYRDLPTSFVTFRWQGKSKSVTDYDRAPAGLKELEERVSSLVGTVHWRKCKLQAKPTATSMEGNSK